MTPRVTERRVRGWLMLTVGVCGLLVLLAIDEAREAVLALPVAAIFALVYWFLERRFQPREPDRRPRPRVVFAPAAVAAFIALLFVLGDGSPPVGVALGFAFVWLGPR